MKKDPTKRFYIATLTPGQMFGEEDVIVNSQ